MKRITGIRKAIASVLTAVLLVAGTSSVINASDLSAEEISGITSPESVQEEGSAPEISSPGAGQALGEIEVNQGFSRHTGLNDGVEVPMDTFVAGKKTAVIMKIPGSDSDAMDKKKAEDFKTQISGYTLQARPVINGEEQDSFELNATGSSFSVKRVYDKNCFREKGWYLVANFAEGPAKGTYNFHIWDGNNNEIGVKKNVTFYETKELNILVVPVIAYWGSVQPYSPGHPVGAQGCKDKQFYDYDGKKRNWNELIPVLKEYMKDVYPVVDVNFEEARELNLGTKAYDMVTPDPCFRNLWIRSAQLQSKDRDGSDRYDLILAFVMYRQGDGRTQGFTCGKPANIITYSDMDMLPTVSHEIAHCYLVGDEYNGGSYNNRVDYPPNGYSGVDLVTDEKIERTSGANPYWQSPSDYANDTTAPADRRSKVDETGKGIIVKPSLHPYCLSREKFIRWNGVDEEGNSPGPVIKPTLGWMGSGYDGVDGLYFNTAVIWDHLLKKLTVKSMWEEEESEEPEEPEGAFANNAEVFLNAAASGTEINEYSVFTGVGDLYYDDSYRFGKSRMAEVFGWLVRDGSGNVKVEMDPIFSYDGDLEQIEPLDKMFEESPDVYTFAALDENGRVLRSPVDGKPATVEFYCSFFNFASNMEFDQANFNFNAEYPEGTKDFVIVKGRLKDADLNKDSVMWSAKDDPAFIADFNERPEGCITYADVNSDFATVEWESYFNADSDIKGEGLYTEVYYCPEGDDGEAYVVARSDEDGWEEGFISFYTDSEFNTPWTRNAYVWIKITNGVNAMSLYSDENEVTLYDSTIALSGAGIRKETVNGETFYQAAYTGNAITPKTAVKAYDPSTGKYISLKKDADYTVCYEDNVNTGIATVTVQGIGAYAGKKTLEFDIVKKNLEGTPEFIPDIRYTDDLDNAVRKYLKMTEKSGRVLIYKTDFTVKYSLNGKEEKSLNKLVTENPGESVTVTVKFFGKGNYTGECKKTATFNVLPASYGILEMTNENTVVELKKNAFTYTGKAIRPGVRSVTVSGNVLKASCYKVIYSGNTGIGTGRVTVVGKKDCTGSAYATFKIDPKPVTNVTISGLKNQPFTGMPLSSNTLPFTVKAGGVTLTEGRDYRIKSLTGELTKVTGQDIRKGGKVPTLEIELIPDDPARKPSERPMAVWKNGAAKPVKKSFSIVRTKLGSSAVDLTAKSHTESENIVKAKNAEGKEVTFTMRNATKQELTEDRNAYTLVIAGTEESLPKGADISDAAVLRAFGRQISASDYSASVSAAGNDKTGTIKLKAAKGKDRGFTGSRTVKFLYIKVEEKLPK